MPQTGSIGQQAHEETVAAAARPRRRPASQGQSRPRTERLKRRFRTRGRRDPRRGHSPRPSHDLGENGSAELAAATLDSAVTSSRWSALPGQTEERVRTGSRARRFASLQA